MATQTVSPRTPAQNTLRGTTFSELEKMVERCLTTGPLMSVGQIRMLLRVFDVCETCDGTGTVTVRGSYSDDVRQERCDACKGRGHVPVLEPVQ